ncbi:MAG TPA: hypothetical protein VGO00_05090 [Kofleriaceae bacterium]|nr:hypothetical protein [Kofleriaceae bacterium]
MQTLSLNLPELSLEALAIVVGGADDPKTVKPIPIAEQPGPAFPTFGIMGSAPPSAYPGWPDFAPRPGAKK